MTKYNTGNPVGSSSPLDLYDNAENLDAGINGPGRTWQDRRGQTRKSWNGIEADFQQFLADGSTIEFPTWAAAAGAAGAGQIPQNRQVTVVGDDGMHADPVSGLPVPNSGRFIMGPSGLEFRGADVLSQKVDKVEFDPVEAMANDSAVRVPSLTNDDSGAVLLADPDGFVSNLDLAVGAIAGIDAAARVVDVSAYSGVLGLTDSDGFILDIIQDDGMPIPPGSDGSSISRFDQIRERQINGVRGELVVAAHRGFFTPHAPGNTMLSFSQSREAGCDVIESDMQITSDGQVVLYHDSDLGTVTNGSGTIASNSIASVRAAQFVAYLGNPIASQCRIPMLTELLAYAARFGALLSLETKRYRTVADISLMVGLVADAGMIADTLFACNSFAEVSAVKQSRADSHVVYQAQGTISDAEIVQLSSYSRCWLSIEKSLLFTNQWVVERCRELGVGMSAFTFEYDSEVAVATRLGVNVVFCNQPIWRG